MAASPSAHASAGQTITFDASSSLTNPGLRERAFADLTSLGVRRLRVLLQWRDVAPSPNASRRPRFAATDPAAYRWGKYDPVMAGAQQDA